MFKRNVFKILAIIFFLLSAASFFYSNKTAPKKTNENKQAVKKKLPPTTVHQGLSVSLIINGASVGTVNVSQGANQCDVLNQALSEGKIQSLNMRYDNNMGTNAVYQINGVGKENAVWWVFKVNGQSPNQGCSYIKVNNGDNSEWSYLGN